MPCIVLPHPFKLWRSYKRVFGEERCVVCSVKKEIHP